MTDPRPPNSDEQSFADLIREAARELKRSRGPCPTSEELVAYFHRSNPEAEFERIRDHVEVCGLCDALLARLQRRPPYRERLRAVFWNPALAYLVVALLVYPAWTGLRRVELSGQAGHQETSTDSTATVRFVPEFSLDQTRGGSVPSIQPRAQEWLLSFFVPAKTGPDYTYDAQIRSREGKLIASRLSLRGDRLGYFHVLCVGRAFPPGEYELRVTEHAPAGPRVVVTYRFEVAR